MHLYCQYKYQFNCKHYYECCAFKYVVPIYCLAGWLWWFIQCTSSMLTQFIKPYQNSVAICLRCNNQFHYHVWCFHVLNILVTESSYKKQKTNNKMPGLKVVYLYYRLIEYLGCLLIG